MDDQTKTELVAAVNLLIRSPQARALYQVMVDNAAALARHEHLRLTGDAEPLNVLARFKVSHPDDYAKLIALAERRRSEAGIEPLVVESEDRFDKVAYMQEFMQQKRIRQRRAAEIENAQRAERDRLIGRARLDFMQMQSAKWKQELDAMIERAVRASPTRLRKDDLRILRAQFWAKVDERLDEAEHAARTGRFQGRDATSLADLEAVLRHDPYA